jgi:hypothetical protein
MTFATKQELENFIGNSIESKNCIKLRLIGSEDGFTESLWGVCAIKEDRIKYDSDESYDEPIKIYLANQPLQGGFWGMAVIAMTRGDNIPEVDFNFDENGSQASVFEENNHLFKIIGLANEEANNT